MMKAEEVAKIITQATFNSNLELILATQGKLIVWLYRFFPRIANRILLHEMNKEPNGKISSIGIIERWLKRACPYWGYQ